MNDTKILSEKIVFQSKYFCVKLVTFERDGKTFTRDIVERIPLVVVLPYTETNEIYLEKQYRNTYRRELLEVVAGHMEANDDPLTAAKRELSEETGLTANKWKKVATWQISSNMQQAIHIFFATELTLGEQHLDEDEIIETIKMPIADALQKISTGEIAVGHHVAVLLLFDKLKKEGKL